MTLRQEVTIQRAYVEELCSGDGFIAKLAF